MKENIAEYFDELNNQLRQLEKNIIPKRITSTLERRLFLALVK